MQQASKDWLANRYRKEPGVELERTIEHLEACVMKYVGPDGGVRCAADDLIRSILPIVVGQHLAARDAEDRYTAFLRLSSQSKPRSLFGQIFGDR